MVTDKEGYIYLIEYLTEHLSLFENMLPVDPNADTVMTVIEEELSEQIISVCNQNEALAPNQRNAIISEVDTIVCDLEEVLARVLNNPISEQQAIFIKEFSSLIKNLFDTEINSLLATNN
ncbi:DUF3802 family protein [Colwellia sp. E150_009]|jgi:hypothetical protein